MGDLLLNRDHLNLKNPCHNEKNYKFFTSSN